MIHINTTYPVICITTPTQNRHGKLPLFNNDLNSIVQVNWHNGDIDNWDKFSVY